MAPQDEAAADGSAEQVLPTMVAQAAAAIAGNSEGRNTRG